ncbi:MAG: DMT family transporter [Desulfoplanes sp.]|nr:DMT family transporter [Desulfoplanes sp.]
MKLFYILLTVIAGCLMPIQPGINSLLSEETSGPYMASLISFVVGTGALFALCLFMRLPFPTLQTVAEVPWWYWCGGLLGAVFVTVTVIVAPRLGAVNMLTYLIAGQMLASLILDHYGVVGFPVHHLNVWRVLGVFFLVVGVTLIKKF